LVRIVMASPEFQLLTAEPRCSQPLCQAQVARNSLDSIKALEMQFVLARTPQEAVHIEAEGIADYQSIISKGLNDQVIEWRGIEATEKLAGSPNAKMIIIGSRKNGLPVILNAAGSPVQQVASK